MAVIDWGRANDTPSPVICPSTYNREARSLAGEPLAAWPDHLCITSRYYISGRVVSSRHIERTPEEEAAIAAAKEAAREASAARDQKRRDDARAESQRIAAEKKKQREAAAKANKKRGSAGLKNYRNPFMPH